MDLDSMQPVESVGELLVLPVHEVDRVPLPFEDLDLVA
jgi:hypothetical protein